MRNYFAIATLAALGASAAASASVAFDVDGSSANWATGVAALPVTYVDPGSISNTSGTGSSFGGGYGWETFALTVYNGGVPPVTLTGAAPAVSMITVGGSTSFPTTQFVFDFVGAEAAWGPSGTDGIYGILFDMNYTGSGVSVAVNGGPMETLTAPSTGAIGVWATSLASGPIDTVTFYLALGSSATITGYTVAIIPAPGAVALLGVAGLITGRRRR
jgi:hypothetical protein